MVSPSGFALPWRLPTDTRHRCARRVCRRGAPQVGTPVPRGRESPATNHKLGPEEEIAHHVVLVSVLRVEASPAARVRA